MIELIAQKPGEEVDEILSESLETQCGGDICGTDGQQIGQGELRQGRLVGEQVQQFGREEAPEEHQQKPKVVNTVGDLTPFALQRDGEKQGIDEVGNEQPLGLVGDKIAETGVFSLFDGQECEEKTRNEDEHRHSEFREDAGVYEMVDSQVGRLQKSVMKVDIITVDQYDQQNRNRSQNYDVI